MHALLDIKQIIGFPYASAANEDERLGQFLLLPQICRKIK